MMFKKQKRSKYVSPFVIAFSSSLQAAATITAKCSVVGTQWVLNTQAHTAPQISCISQSGVFSLDSGRAIRLKHCIAADLGGTGPNCVFGVSKSPGLSPKRSQGTAKYNQLMRLLNKQSEANASRQEQVPQSNLAKIAERLVLAELNRVSGGIPIKEGVAIDEALLTEEQRGVLRDHVPLMNEAIRQLKKNKINHVALGGKNEHI